MSSRGTPPPPSTPTTPSAPTPTAPSTLATRLERAWLTRGPLAWSLRPVAALFGAIAATRRALFRAGVLHSTRLPVPVIVVGNIFIGGTGKTPLTIWLAEALRAAGYTPGVISRGHGGADGGVRLVTPDSPAQDVGDEPLLIARRARVPVMVGRQRAAAGRALLAAHPEVDVLITDDGLQHYALQRDIEIVLFDARALGNGWLLPAGPLREPATRARDFTVVNLPDAAAAPTSGSNPASGQIAPIARAPTSGSNPASGQIAPMAHAPTSGSNPASGQIAPIARAPTPGSNPASGQIAPMAHADRPDTPQFVQLPGLTPAWRMQLVGDVAEQLAAPHARVALAELAARPGQHLVAAAGIGNPGRFFALLRAAGLTFTELPLPDHHDFLDDPFGAVDADLILITEKDAVKCGQLENLKHDPRLWVVPVTARLDAALAEQIVEKCRGCSPA